MIYAIKMMVSDFGEFKVMRVKIGKTRNIKNRLRVFKTEKSFEIIGERRRY